MRIATYNVEWFASLFDPENKLAIDNSWSGRHDVTKQQQINALGEVFKVIDADAIMVIEAPNNGSTQSTVASLEEFAAHFKLRQNKAILGFPNDTQQEIALLYDPTKMDAKHAPMGLPTDKDGSHAAPRFDGVFRRDVNVDDRPEKITFSKPPLELLITPKQGDPFRMIGVHAKSKAPHGARTEAEAFRIAISNRRKQLAQCIWIRQRVDQLLDAGDPLIVLGDFNDGPGLDEYEKLFGQSGVELVIGPDKGARMLHDPHAKAALRPRPGVVPTTSRFYNHRTKSYLNALLDYVMLSDDLFVTTNPIWRIWHPFDDLDCFSDDGLCKALLTASDHFPVTVDLDISE